MYSMCSPQVHNSMYMQQANREEVYIIQKKCEIISSYVIKSENKKRILYKLNLLSVMTKRWFVILWKNRRILSNCQYLNKCSKIVSIIQNS